MSRSLPQAVLLVDGYNIIGTWSCLKKTRDDTGLEAARWQLAEALLNYSAFQGFVTQIVFDAQYQNTGSNQEIITQNLSVYYTDFGQTADTYIEKSCASFRPYLRGVLPQQASPGKSSYQSRPSRLIVATSDRVQQLMVLGYGAEWMSAQKYEYCKLDRRSLRVNIATILELSLYKNKFSEILPDHLPNRIFYR